MKKTELLFTHLRRIERDYARVRIRHLVLSTALCAGTLLLLFLSLDARLHFSGFQAFLFQLLFWGSIAYCLKRRFVVNKKPLSSQHAALLTEKYLGDKSNSLVNAVQMEQHGKTCVAEAILEDDAPDLEAVSGESFIPAKDIRSLRLSCRILISTAVVLFILSPPGFLVSCTRFLIPFSGIQPWTRTRITDVSPGNAVVKRGEELTIELQTSGAVPHNPKLIWTRGQNKQEIIPLTPVPNDRKSIVYTAASGGIYADATYRVEAGDALSGSYSVRVKAPPSLDSWKATITPPVYTKRKAFTLTNRNVSEPIPVGSQINFSGTAAEPLVGALIRSVGKTIAETRETENQSFRLPFRLESNAPYELILVDRDNLKITEILPFTILSDRPPKVKSAEENDRFRVDLQKQIGVSFLSEDDYGLSSVSLERTDTDQPIPLAVVEIEGVPRRFVGRFLIAPRQLGARTGDILRFRFKAEDIGPGNLTQIGYSSEFIVEIPAMREKNETLRNTVSSAEAIINELIDLQGQNLNVTTKINDREQLGFAADFEQLQDVLSVQNLIRKKTADLLKNREALGAVGNTLYNLYNNEMNLASALIDTIPASEGAARRKLFADATRNQRAILASLKGIPFEFRNDLEHRKRSALFNMMTKLVNEQKQIVRSIARIKSISNPTVSLFKETAADQDRTANRFIAFTDECALTIDRKVDPEFAERLRTVLALTEDESVYENMLRTAEEMDATNLPPAEESALGALQTLMKILNILNKWRAQNAADTVSEAAEKIEAISEKLEEMEKSQAKIAEVTRSLALENKDTEEADAALRQMDKEQEEMADLVEQLANDLYQFPDLPVCNELNSKMREIYEAVEQALGSENAPTKEIAVQKEDALLEAIKNTKERVEDVEMWLPDVPDNIVWNMESFDTDELPDIPLVPLPDELEDLVGDLLEQAEAIAQQSEDSTGNNIIADTEMGWSVSDGPMPSFAAKGKSGNTRPNDNEMTGRSGAGREGQSTGELVENYVKGLEGTETHARRTADPYQSGSVEEAEDSALTAKSTGGGKLGGESESVGMFGAGPRKDLKDGGSPAALRRETEALYATARLLYLADGGLGAAAGDLKNLENSQQIQEFGGLHQKVLRRLNDARVEIDSGAVLPLNLQSGTTGTKGAAAKEVDLESLPEEYRDIVSDYYQSLKQ